MSNLVVGNRFTITAAAMVAVAESATSAKPAPTWYNVVECLNALDLGESLGTALLGELRRVFGDGSRSAQQVMDWLQHTSGPCGGRPVDLLAGKVPGVPMDTGARRVLAYLSDAADAPTTP